MMSGGMSSEISRKTVFFWHCYLSTHWIQTDGGNILPLDSAEAVNRVAQIHLTWSEGTV